MNFRQKNLLNLTCPMNCSNIKETKSHSFDQCTSIPSKLMKINEAKMDFIYRDLIYQTLAIKKYFRIHLFRKSKIKHLPGDERPATLQ